MSKYNIDNGKKIMAALLMAGANPLSLPFLMSQVAHETGGFNSRVFSTNNNASGIMWINKPTVQKNAKKGSPFPKKEGKYFYAYFNSLQDWAKDYLRIVGKTAQQATTFAQYAQNLKDRRYYTDTVKNYANGLINQWNAIKKLYPDLAAVTVPAGDLSSKQPSGGLRSLKDQPQQINSAGIWLLLGAGALYLLSQR